MGQYSQRDMNWRTNVFAAMACQVLLPASASAEPGSERSAAGTDQYYSLPSGRAVSDALEVRVAAAVVPPEPQYHLMRGRPEEYPASAIRNEQEGIVHLELLIGKAGEVLDCEIVASSGHRVLDEAACYGWKRSGRFSPARSADGEVTESTWSTTVTYSLD